jgi:hypothetical protein
MKNTKKTLAIIAIVVSIYTSSFAANAAIPYKISGVPKSITWEKSLSLPITVKHQNKTLSESDFETFYTDLNDGKVTIEIVGNSEYKDLFFLETYSVYPRKTKVIDISETDGNVKLTWKKVSTREATGYLIYAKQFGEINYKIFANVINTGFEFDENLSYSVKLNKGNWQFKTVAYFKNDDGEFFVGKNNDVFICNII